MIHRCYLLTLNLIILSAYDLWAADWNCKHISIGILLFCCCCRCWGHSASNDGGNSAASDIWSVCRIQKTNWKQEARLLQAEGRQKKASSACVCKSTESLCKVLIDQYALHLPVQFTCSPFVHGTVLCIAHSAFDWLCHMICNWQWKCNIYCSVHVHQKSLHAM